MATTSTRDAQQRARAKLAERRNREDQLIDAVTGALVTREEATRSLAAAEAAITEAVAGLAELGIGRDELAAILEVPADQLGAKTRGRPRKAAPAGAEAPAQTGAEAEAPEAAAEATPPGKPTRAVGRTRKARATARSDAGGS
jgi:pilus assembly protein FimV